MNSYNDKVRDNFSKRYFLLKKNLKMLIKFKVFFFLFFVVAKFQN